MRFGRLKAFIEENFPEKTLVVVSSREPYVHKTSSSGIKVEKPAGGLTSALDDILRTTGGVWVAWGSGNADRAASKNARVRVPPENPSYLLRRVWLTPSAVNNYYHGYSNRVLWPLCHIALNRVYFKRRYWEEYRKVNAVFAKAVIEEAPPSSVVWVHDYHLCLAPKLIREKRPDLTIAHFWHIPWPDWGVFRACPQARELIEGLLSADLIGFQIPQFVKNFMGCARESLDCTTDPEASTISWGGRTVRTKAFPISVDYVKFSSEASSKRTETTIKKIKGEFKIKGVLGIGVDRLEYTKALIKRLQAIELFFEKYPRFRGKVTFVQIAVPTRMKEPYISYRQAVEELVNKINSRFSTRAWRPVVYLDRKADVRELAVYYRMSDVAIVSSIYDGMNLVAKEYIASQVDCNGVLILSEFAGAAEELEGALLVNPYDLEDFAKKIKLAVEMPPRERKARMEMLRNHVREHDIYKWISDILDEIARISSIKERTPEYFFDHAGEIGERLSRERPFLFLDFDGTLTPIVSTPGEAVLGRDVRALLEELKELLPVSIISGRSLNDIKKRVGIPDLVYAGNHGAEVWDGSKVISQNFSSARDLLERILARLRQKLSHIEGVLVEDKGVTASVHFRLVSAKDLSAVFDIFSKVTEPYGEQFRITSGKKVFEIRPKEAWDKGAAVKWMSDHLWRGKTALYIGDDTTDEDAYRAIKGKGISVSVGVSSESDYYLKDQGEVMRFLEFIKESVGAGVKR